MSRHAIYGALILMVCAISAVAGISANYTGSATLPAPQNVTLSGTTEGIDVRWNIPPGSDEVANYQIAYQATERQRADSWTYMWTQGKTSTHLIRHLAGGYEYRVYVRSCSTQCNSEWAYGGTVWTQKPNSPTPKLTPVPTSTPIPTPTPQPTGITIVPQLLKYEAMDTPQTYLKNTEYRILVEWTGSPNLHLEVAWREVAKGDEWTIIGPRDMTYHVLRYLKPATNYEAKARHWHPEMGYGPWSDANSLRSVDEPPPLAVCVVPIKNFDGNPVTHVTRDTPVYLGMFSSQSSTGVIQFTNPNTDEWEYGFRIRQPGSYRVEIVVRSDRTWEARTWQPAKFGERNEWINDSGTLILNTRAGETNEILYSTRGGVYGYYRGLFVNGVWTKFDPPSAIRGISLLWLDVIAAHPEGESLEVPIAKVQTGSQCGS